MTYKIEISYDIREEFYFDLYKIFVKSMLKRKIMDKIQETLNFHFEETTSPVPNNKRIIASVEWIPGE